VRVFVSGEMKLASKYPWAKMELHEIEPHVIRHLGRANEAYFTSSMSARVISFGT